MLWQNGKVTALATLGGSESSAAAINDRGQIVGDSDLKNGEMHGFLWQHGKLTQIGAPGASYETWALNEHGQVIGNWHKRTWRNAHVFLWQNGKTTDLGPTEDPYAIAINDRGEVIDTRQPQPGATRGLLWRDGKMTDLGSLGGPRTYPIAINNRGQIVGVSSLAGSTDEVPNLRAFVWQNRKLTELPTPVFFLDSTMAIDNTGTHIALGTPLYGCDAPDDCGGHLLLWTHPR